MTAAAIVNALEELTRSIAKFIQQGGDVMLSLSAIVAIVLAIAIVAILYSAVRILREYERGVVFTLGRYTGTKGPGFFLLSCSRWCGSICA
jgi:hypothetical protein